MITTKVLKALLQSNVTFERLASSSSLHARNFSSYRHSSSSSNSNSRVARHKWQLASILAGGTFLGYLVYNNKTDKEILENLPRFSANNATAKAEDVFSSSDVEKHKTKDTGIWVSYKGGVYDITKFVEEHPGGEKIMLGAGGPIDPFWNMYAVHQTPEVLEILEEYRIGKLKAEDRPNLSNLDDPFANEPTRLPFFRINSSKPYNAEPPLAVITDSYITPNELFYVRNHLPVPDVDPCSFRLEVKVGEKKVVFSLEQLKRRYKPVTITTTIQCAGNRRAEMSDFKTVKGLSWGTCAIGTARWTGVRLRDVLKDAGFSVHDKRFKHIHFNGGDVDITKSCYGASIPKQKAMSEDGDVIIAYKMNGVDIPRDHGYPLRAIVPGYVGARNVKWLNEIEASDVESWSHWQRNDYKGFSPSTTFETADYDKAQAIQEMPVVSAISAPLAHSRVEPFDGSIEVQGYAWSGGGRDIIRVDVSADGGKTWKEAELIKDEPNADDSAQCWAWTLWKADLPVEPGKEHEIVCKAVDSSYNSQPEGIGAIWNLRGFLTNSWHRVPVKILEE